MLLCHSPVHSVFVFPHRMDFLLAASCKIFKQWVILLTKYNFPTQRKEKNIATKGAQPNWDLLSRTPSFYTKLVNALFAVLNGQKGTHVHSLCYFCVTAVTLMTVVNNVHASSPWFFTVGLLVHISAHSLLCHISWCSFCTHTCTCLYLPL